jgi:hypothetical protein
LIRSFGIILIYKSKLNKKLEKHKFFFKIKENRDAIAKSSKTKMEKSSFVEMDIPISRELSSMLLQI